MPLLGRGLPGISKRWMLWHEYSRVQRRLWLLWTFSTAIGLGIGAGLAELVSGAVAEESGLHNLLFSPRWQVSVGFCFGAPALLAQYLVLRTLLPESLRWIAMTTMGLAIGAVVGAFVGLAAAMVTLALGFGCQATSASACESIFFLTFPAAGGAAGAVAGGAMGTLLRMGPREWSQEWTWPLARAWAGIGAIFWILAPLLLRQPFTEAGLLDTDATLASIALAGVAGLAAGAMGGVLSAGHFARTALLRKRMSSSKASS